MPHYISTTEAGLRKGVSGRTIRRWIASGYLRAYRVGPRNLFIDPADLDALTFPVGAVA